MKSHVQVAVIGGGVVGASVLYHLARAGWKSTLLKPGDKVSIIIRPLLTADPGGQFVSVTLPEVCPVCTTFSCESVTPRRSNGCICRYLPRSRGLPRF